MTRTDMTLRSVPKEPSRAVRTLLADVLSAAGYRVLASDHVVDPLDLQQLRPSPFSST
jgi:hypothetical protein